MGTATVPERHPLRLVGLIVGGAAVVLALAAAILFVWLRGYAPLDAARPFAPGPGLGADIEPVTGSGGRPVLVPAYRAGRTFDTAVTLHNSGRFAVDVVGLADEPGAGAPELQADDLLATDSSTAGADPRHLHPFRRLRLDRGDTAVVVVRWRLDCSHSEREVSADRVPLRFSYLSLFTRTERVELPFAVTLRCSS